MLDTVTCTAQGVVVTTATGQQLQRAWAEVTAVTAYCVDAVDRRLLYLSFEDESGHALEVVDDAIGWQELVSGVRARTSIDVEERLRRLAPGDDPIVLYARETARHAATSYGAVLFALDGRGSIGPPASTEAIHAARHALGCDLPASFEELLRHADGFLLHDGTCLFGTGQLVERNVTLEVREYMPGYVAIGDDSGGQVYVLHLDPAEPSVYRVGAGVMTAGALECVAPDLIAWLGRPGFGCLED